MIDPGEAVRRLHAIDHQDPEVAHRDAEAVLLEGGPGRGAPSARGPQASLRLVGQLVTAKI